MALLFFSNGELLSEDHIQRQTLRDSGESELWSFRTVEELMTPDPLVAIQTDPCELALEELEHEDFHHLPVVSDSGHLLGIVSDRDLLRCPDLSVGEVMVKRVLVCFPDTETQIAAKGMIEERIHCLVVVDKSLIPVGILSSYDLLQHLVLWPKEI